MSDAAMWALAVGFVSATFIIPVIQRPTWPPRTRAAVTFAYSIVAGAGTAWFTADLDRADWHSVKAAVSAMLLVFVSAISTYKGLAQYRIAPAIERATSPTPTAED